MADKTEEAPKKKGKMGKIIVITVGAIVLIGGGVAGGVYASGALGGGKHVEEEKGPKLVLKAEQKRGGGGEEVAAGEGHGASPSISDASKKRSSRRLYARSDADGQLHQHQDEQPDADDAVDLEERLVDPAQVVRPDQGVLVGQQHGDEDDAAEIDVAQPRRDEVQRDEHRQHDEVRQHGDAQARRHA